MLKSINQPTTGTITPYNSCVTPNPTDYNNYNQKDLFYLELYYDNPIAGSNGSSRKNGEISGVRWQTKGRSFQNYSLNYDQIGQLKGATYYDFNHSNNQMISTNRYSTSYQYDLRGNITNLDRNGVLSPSNCSSHEKIDDLSYSYNSNDANRLHDINDTAPGLGNNAGFKNGNGNYTYDSNGNITYDPYKKISIAYNHLDKPTQISYFSKRGSARCIRFKYDADGNRLQKSLHIDELELERRDYIAGFEYLAGNIESIMHSEGRISIANGHAKYEYTFKDHLGNTRLVYSDLNLDGIINVNTEILQESHYYPFGMEMNGSYIQNTNTDYRYKYNGIERLKDFDIGVDFAYFRVLDPVIGRWWQVDPKGRTYAYYNSLKERQIECVLNKTKAKN